MMSRYYNAQATNTTAIGWQPLQKVDRVGVFNGVTATGAIIFNKVEMNNTGIASVVYKQSNGTINNLWSNQYPFINTTPKLLENKDIELGKLINYTLNSNGDGIVSFNYIDGTFWTNQYSGNTSTWEIEKQISTIPTISTNVKSFKFNGNRQLIIYNENGKIKATSYSPTNSWETPITISNFANDYSQIYYNKSVDMVVVTWKSLNALVVRKFILNAGWQAEKNIVTFTDPTLYFDAQIIVHNDRSMSAIWYQKNIVSGKRDIYTIKLQ